METNNKLREALEKCANWGEQIDCQLGSSDETVYTFRDERCLAHNISECARAALAEPVKNCEVGSPEEQLARFKKFCARFDCCDCPVRKKWNFKPTGDESCQLLWASMHYEEKEEVAEPPKKDEIKIPEVPPRLEPCPKCGKDAARFNHPAFDGGSYVSCTECHFSPQAETWAYTDAEAAKKWNKMERN